MPLTKTSVGIDSDTLLCETMALGSVVMLLLFRVILLERECALGWYA